MKSHITILLLTLLIASCGIFQPRETFEIPEIKVYVDRFNFGAIFDGKRFVWKNYETFFCDTLRYSNLNSGVYGKKNLIDRLQQIELQYPRFSIKWKDIKNNPIDNVKTITNVTYTVIYDSVSVDLGTFTGSSTMVIIRDVEYKIAAWDDFHDGEQKSFFAPLD